MSSVDHVPQDDIGQANRIDRWATAAIADAEVEKLVDPEGFYFATVPNAPGAWSYEPTVDEALAGLHEVLVRWAIPKLADGDDDIPDFAGIRLGGR